jgi:hypothetical protein
MKSRKPNTARPNPTSIALPSLTNVDKVLFKAEPRTTQRHAHHHRSRCAVYHVSRIVTITPHQQGDVSSKIQCGHQMTQ